jgi:hypothetical protein
MSDVFEGGSVRYEHQNPFNKKELKMNTKKLFVTSLLLISFVLASATAVFALEPSIESFHDEGTQSLNCGSFVASGPYQQNVRATTFYDEAGNPIRVSFFIQFTGTLTNPTNDKSLTDTDSFTYIIDLQKGTETGVGLTFHMQIPGGGVAVLDAGRIYVDEDGNVTLTGRRDFESGGKEVICAALQ